MANEKDPKSSTYRPSAPSTFIAQISPDYLNITLTWKDNSVAETGFILYKRNESVGSFLKLAELSENEESYIDSLEVPITSAVIYRLVSVSDTTQSEAQDIRVIASYPLEVNIIGDGRVTEENISMKINDYEFGSIIRLTPIPDSTSVFINWQGDVDGETEVIEVIVNAPKSVIANFDRKFKLMENGVTVDCSLAEYGEIGVIGDKRYVKLTQIRLSKVKELEQFPCTSGITDMRGVFEKGFTSRPKDTLNLDLRSWDVSNVTDMSRMFLNSDFVVSDINSWDVSSVTTMKDMFNSSPFNQNISDWDVSNVIDMSGMFNSSSFNQVIEKWNVSNVTDMNRLFVNSSFNRNLNSWDVSNVTDMKFMFANNESFNQDLNNWNTSNVENMDYMFQGANYFNGKIDGWDITEVNSVEGMFYGASSFNQDLSNWNTAKIANMNFLFRGASAFNGDISSWNVSNVESMLLMFSGADQFNSDISKWDVSMVKDMRMMFVNAKTFNQDIGNWDIYNADITQMFYGASSFNQDLSNWCTPLSEAEYAYSFRYGSALIPENMPNWGCTRN